VAQYELKSIEISWQLLSCQWKDCSLADALLRDGNTFLALLMKKRKEWTRMKSRSTEERWRGEERGPRWEVGSSFGFFNFLEDL
jgi:hypothetical protein